MVIQVWLQLQVTERMTEWVLAERGPKRTKCHKCQLWRSENFGMKEQVKAEGE